MAIPRAQGQGGTARELGFSQRDGWLHGRSSADGSLFTSEKRIIADEIIGALVQISQVYVK
jgi:hypothetical protein